MYREIRIGDKIFQFKEEFTKNPDVWFKSDNSFVKVYLDDKCVFEWDNEANIDYPEDLIWEREIHKVFYKGFELGYLLATKQKED